MSFSNEEVKAILDRIEARLGIMRKRKYEFYSECGLSSAAYSQWNTGKNTPSPAMLRRIAEYLGVSYEWLISGEEENVDSEETKRIRQALLDRPELRILFNAAEDAPASEILNAAAQIMKYKEQSQ